MTHTVILLRHGQSEWNRDNLFTGWADVDLTEAGREEARAAAHLLAREGLGFDIAFTSLLKRAIRTLWIVMDEMDRMWVPVRRSWRLNERHYGTLQGLSKSDTLARHGPRQVAAWRRGFEVRPPPVDVDDQRHPANDPRYRDIPRAQLPAGESLRDTLARVEPYWTRQIVPRLRSGQRVLIAGHGNSLRALIRMLEGFSTEDAMGLTLPTAAPLVYRLDADFGVLERRRLGDPEAWEAADTDGR